MSGWCRYLIEYLTVTRFWLEESNDPTSLQPYVVVSRFIGRFLGLVDHSIRATSAHGLELTGSLGSDSVDRRGYFSLEEKNSINAIIFYCEL